MITWMIDFCRSWPTLRSKAGAASVTTGDLGHGRCAGRREMLDPARWGVGQRERCDRYPVTAGSRGVREELFRGLSYGERSKKPGRPALRARFVLLDRLHCRAHRTYSGGDEYTFSSPIGDSLAARAYEQRKQPKFVAEKRNLENEPRQELLHHLGLDA